MQVPRPGRTPVILVACAHDEDPARVVETAATARRLSASLERHGRVRAHAVWFHPDDLDDFWACVASEEPALTVVLPRVNPTLRENALARRQEPGGPVIVSGDDASAVALTAATLINVSHRRRGTTAARVLLAHPARLPSLNPLLSAAEVGELTLWNPADAVAFPLKGIAREVDVVINLLDRPDDHLAEPYRSEADTNCDVPIVLEPDNVTDPLLVLPGLLQALAVRARSAPGLAELDRAYQDMCLACALELVMATPPAQASLPRPGPELTARLAIAAIGSATRQARPSHRGPGSNGAAGPDATADGR
ncbi:malate dehydrogenase (oxaloacetate-decarboxylating) [Pseudonocardia eucalypti]|nr:malate dehydrogenase (oxaloacetate-decarboxylating) [Pseudonocardia eucalypti]